MGKTFLKEEVRLKKLTLKSVKKHRVKALAPGFSHANISRMPKVTSFKSKEQAKPVGFLYVAVPVLPPVLEGKIGIFLYGVYGELSFFLLFS